MNEPNKLDCLSPASLSSLVKCNTVAFWANLQDAKKLKCCEEVLYLSLMSLGNPTLNVEAHAHVGSRLAHKNRPGANPKILNLFCKLDHFSA
jgi:hypothetical protein